MVGRSDELFPACVIFFTYFFKVEIACQRNRYEEIKFNLLVCKFEKNLAPGETNDKIVVPNTGKTLSSITWNLTILHAINQLTKTIKK